LKQNKVGVMNFNEKEQNSLALNSSSDDFINHHKNQGNNKMFIPTEESL
jgi:hypothetical protein